MKSIIAYIDLIKTIPVQNQSTRVHRDVWKKFFYGGRQKIEDEIFGNNTSVELSRKEVHEEKNIAKKIFMVLMWGYPTGGRGNNIKNTLKEIDRLGKILSEVAGKDLTKNEAAKLFVEFNSIHGLGISTWSKLLYFFDVSLDSKKCQIFDIKIVDSLNKRQFSEAGSNKWIQDNNHYYQYIELLDSLSKKMKVRPDQLELFFFYYNLEYKF